MPERPATADLADSVMLRRLEQILHIGANAYLVALAAWQRGLKVTFHSTFAHSKRFAHLPFSGYRGEFFTVSDGQTSHDFYRVMSDLTTREASAIAESKPHTKAVLARAGVEVAAGGVVLPGKTAVAERLLARHPGKRFVIKPVNGTLGRGVLRNLEPQHVRSSLVSITQPMLLEESLSGTEYRVYVTGERVNLALIRRPASVVGNGEHTIAQLVEAKGARRRRHPVYREEPWGLDEAVRAFLAQQERDEHQVPAAGERVFLSDVPSLHEGGDMIDGSDSLSPLARETAIRAARALGLPHAGLDMIVTHEGGRERCVVIEANQNPYIRLSALPMAGIFEAASNGIAESIIDHHFPSSLDSPRYPRASFDFLAICRILQSGVVGEVSLPVLGQDGAHRRLTLPATQVDQAMVDRIQHLRLRHGMHVQLLKNDTGDITLDGVATQEHWEALCRIVQAN